MLPAINILLSFILLKSISIDANFVTSDYLQNVYVITNENNLQKIDSAGNILFHYNQNRFGILKNVDATNPMKIILSYPDFGTVVWLDNTLTEVGLLSLKKIGIYSSSAVCFSSKDNNIWIFDDQEYKLKKIDFNGNIIIESSDMFQLMGYAVHPVFMMERDQFLYVSDPEIGILVFDSYGSFKETLHLKNIYKFTVINNEIYYWEGKQIFVYGINSLEEKHISLPENDKAIDLSIDNNRLYLLENSELKLYRF